MSPPKRTQLRQTNLMDIGQLHQILRQAGFIVPESELRKKVLGPGSTKAIKRFQNEHGLPATGTVDKDTVKALNEATGKPGPIPTKTPLRSPARKRPAESGKALPSDGAPRSTVRQIISSFAQVAGFTGKTEQALSEKVLTIDMISDSVLRSLIEKKTLEESEARRLGTITSLYNLCDQNMTLVRALGEKVQTPRQLAAYSETDWKTHLEKAKVPPPDGMSIDQYAALLAGRLATLFPTNAFFSRVIALDSGAFAKRLEELNAGERTRFANTYPGLNLGEILNDPKLSPTKQVEQVAGRIGILDRVRSMNPDLELLDLDYSHDSEELKTLKWDGLTSDEQQMALSTLKACQRIHNVAGENDMKAILEAGYTSAAGIAKSGLDAFAGRTGLPAASAKKVYNRAQETVAELSSAVGAFLDAFKGGFDWLTVCNLDSQVKDFLRRLDGFSALFGSQATCNCEHCQSILGPAAYFVDLMSFVEENVLNKVFTGNKTDHVLNLKKRRPDLWTLPLTCENTNERIPTLTIVNEVLENYLARNGGYSGALLDRTLVEQTVYETLSNAKDSFRQPFVLPLERVQSYLGHFNRNRAEVAAAVGASEAVMAAAILGVSDGEYRRIREPDTGIDSLRNLYGIQFNRTTPDIIDAFDAHLLLSPMGLIRTELANLVATRFVAAGSTNPILIRAEKLNAESIQNDIERIHNLTLNSLDRMHRFTRLWRRLTWTIGELDLVLSHLGGQVSVDLGQVLADLVKLHEVQQRLGCPVEELCTLWGEIPRTTTSASGIPLFERLFNLSPFNENNEAFPKDNTRFVHPAFLTPDPIETNSDNTLRRLLAGIGASDQNLVELIRRLSGPLGFDPDAEKKDERGFLLSVPNLSLLYRHARLAERLKVSVTELFQLLKYAVPAVYVSDLAGLQQLLSLYNWWGPSGYTLDDIGFVTGGEVLDPRRYFQAFVEDGAATGTAIELEAANVVINEVTNALSFSDTIFAFLGISEEQSRSIVAANSTRFTSDGTAYRLTAGFDPALYLTIPTGVVKDDDQAEMNILKSKLQDALLNYHPLRILPIRLAAHLGMPVEKVAALIELNGANLADVALAESMQQKKPEILAKLLKSLLPLTVLFGNQIYDHETLIFVRDHQGIFGITKFSQITLETIRRLSVYAAFAERGGDASFTGAEPKTNPADLQNVLAGFDPDKKFTVLDAQNRPVVDPERLARIVQTESGLAAALAVKLAEKHLLPDAPLDALQKLDRCAELARYIGVSGDTMLSIVSSEYGELALAADGVLAAFRAKYSEEKEREEKLRPFEDRIRMGKRNALVDFLLHSLPGTYEPESGRKRRPFETPNELYNYFLIDVQTGGDATLSRVVSAISSVQLYVHRCLLNLEQDRRDPGDPQSVQVKPSEDMCNQWVWRKNYRVWEANRKVFLYPENYLEPELRDNKTPLFETLESELLQQEINEQTILDAYAGYLSGFEEVATLEIAGVYHDIQKARVDNKEIVEGDEKEENGDSRDILHLFGATSTDPPIYYYRTVENLYNGSQAGGRGTVWYPWRKINVQIPVRRVAPVVYQGRLHVFWVCYNTRPLNTVTDGESKFTGYQHKMSIKFTTLRLDGSWTPPQEVSPDDLKGDVFSKGTGVIIDPLLDGSKITGDQRNVGVNEKYEVTSDTAIQTRVPKYSADHRDHDSEPQDGYALTGSNWEELFLDPVDRDEKMKGLTLVGRNFQLYAKVDLFRHLLYDLTAPSEHEPPESGFPLLCGQSAEGSDGKVQLYYAFPKHWYTSDNAFANLVLEQKRLDIFKIDCSGSQADEDLRSAGGDSGVASGISDRARLLAVSGSIEDVILQDKADVLLFQGSARSGPNYLLRRIGTTIAESLAEKLFTSDLDELLKTSNQQSLKDEEDPLPLTPEDAPRVEVADKLRKLDFTNSYGTYYWEIFFHTPFLIANHLNSQQQFAAAQRWYHYIFNPTASDAEESQPPSDRNWRFIEFRNLGITTLLDILTDKNAIAMYRDNPFNPHVIARLRPTAYQKAVVMKYIDNLLDWGDSLFAQFTTESVNEATLLYVMAADILGEKPAEVGDCGLKEANERTYEKIAPLSEENGSEFLRELESYIGGKVGGPGSNKPWRSPGFEYVVDHSSVRAATRTIAKKMRDTTGETVAQAVEAVKSKEALGKPKIKEVFRGTTWKEAKNSASSGARAGHSSARRDILRVDETPIMKDGRLLTDFQNAFFAQIGPVFCIPANKDLQSYWDRVDDRLFKIRNSMDITGVRRELALFAPEIDPRLLVRMQAVGLSLEDVLNVTSGNLPPYRFAYLIEKAKGYASTLQGFGAALLSALEKKDVEELAQLRTVHEQNLLKLNAKVRQWEIEAAEDATVTLERQKEAAEYRRDHYSGLIEEGRIPSEIIQAVSSHLVSSIHTIEGTLGFLAATLTLQPDVGSPFAMKYGGTQLSGNIERFACATGSLAAVAQAVAASSGFEAGVSRRAEEWRHQVKLAEHELKQLDKQLEAADIRKKIAERSKEIHEKTVKQMEEVYEFYSDKFTGLGLYTWLSTTLQRLYREAYNSAFAMAKLTEQAFRFERGIEDEPLLDPGYWDASHAGLLAGERLLIDLQTLECRFIETNYRSLEINQAFSLNQIDPESLVQLREKGTCQFEIPEFFFDLFYPGQYRRLIKAVRVTIPCVTGPYTNVSATLTLLDSTLRREPGEKPVSVPPKRTVSIATSTAQNDAGVFELNFRDERYMPFEGAGATSSWQLVLPMSFRPFDYQTISDVILHISYTAEEDNEMRKDVEKSNADFEKTLVQHLSETGLVRVFSMRYDFPSAFQALLHNPNNTPVEIEITDKFFPIFLAGRSLAVHKAQVALKTAVGQAITNVSISVDSEVSSDFTGDLGGLPAAKLRGNIITHLKAKHTLAVISAGNLACDGPPSTDVSAVDSSKLMDVLLCVEYGIVTTN